MLRLLIPTDAPTYQHLRLTSLKTDPLSFLSPYELESTYPTSYFADRIRYATRLPIYGIYGLLEDARLIAATQIALEYHVKQRHLANIYEVYVLPENRRSGHATTLLSHIISLAKTDPQLEQLHLRVNSDNTPAINLYKKLGFTLYATRKDAVKEADNTYQNELMFMLKLK